MLSRGRTTGSGEQSSKNGEAADEVFDDIPITAIVTMEAEGTGTRYVFTALHRDEADLETNKASGFYAGTEIAVDQFVEHVLAMK